MLDAQWSNLGKLRRIGLVSPDHQSYQIVVEVCVYGLQKRRRFAPPRLREGFPISNRLLREMHAALRRSSLA